LEKVSNDTLEASMGIPKYRKHPNGQAFVKVIAVNNGQPLYLGRYNSPESKKRYANLLDQLDAGVEVNRDGPYNSRKTIAEVVVRFLPYAEGHYTRGNELSAEYNSVKHALKPLLQLFGDTLASEFGPRKLKEIQRHMAKTLSRKVVNRRTNRIRMFWQWASSEEYVPPELYHGLLSVQPLTLGQYGAKEHLDVGPVDRATVDATLSFLTPAPAAMVRLQLYTGMRSSEVCCVRWCDIDTSRETWLYCPQQHKNKWRGRKRTVAIPRDAQWILDQYAGMPDDQYLFSPKVNLRMTGRTPRAGIKDKYTYHSYGQAIRCALNKAAKQGVSIPHWHPHQLRHTRATEISQTLGEQAAQVFLGHESLSTTGIYAARQLVELLDVSARLGASAPQSQAATAAVTPCPPAPQ
jgi:integrase